eukprot:GEZU01026717.1.p1 GENE.GEZU01026717.1~~GEZU01026717.1.p1  ORF type:complete len:274 (+),score=80.25 GEZU01026717.1:62-883(+)
MTDAEILAQVQLDFNAQLNPDQPPPQLNSEFVYSSKVGTIDIAGGDPSVPVNQLSQRIPTFVVNPAITTFTYRPITDFISDPTIRANVEQAIAEYLSEAAATVQEQNAQAAAARQAAWLGAHTIYAVASNPYMSLPHIQICPYSTVYGSAPLTANQNFSQPMGEIPFFNSELPMVMCERNAQGQLRATLPDLTIICDNPQIYGIDCWGPVEPGEWVSAGCSTAGEQYTPTFPYPTSVTNGYSCCFDAPPMQVGNQPPCNTAVFVESCPGYQQQ